MADFRRRGALAMRGRPPLGPRVIDEEITPSSGWTDNSEFHFLLVDVPGYEKDDIKLDVEEAGTIVVKGSRKKSENRREHFEKSFDVPEDGDIKSISMEFDGITLRVCVPKVPKKDNGEQKGTDEGSSSGTKKEDKEEPNPPAMRPSSPPKEDKPKESKSHAPVSPEDQIRSEVPEPSDKGKETNGEAEQPKFSRHEHTNGIDEDEGPKIPPTRTEPAQNSHDENGKQKKPEMTKKVENEKKPNDQGQREESSGQAKKSSVMGKVVENKGILIASLVSFTLGVLLSQKFHHPPPHP